MTRRNRSASARKSSRTRMKTQSRAARVRAAFKALAGWPEGTVSLEAMSRQGKEAAARRSPGSRSRSARRAVRTQGAAGRSEAAKKASRTRRRRT